MFETLLKEVDLFHNDVVNHCLQAYLKSKKLNYVEMVQCLKEVIDGDITRLIIMHYLADEMDFFSLPLHVQNAVEQRFCVYDSKNMQWTMFGVLHGPGHTCARSDFAGDNYDSDFEDIFPHEHASEWWKCGELHRDHDLPAIMTGDGSMLWYQRGLRHREHDKPAVIDTTQNAKFWYMDGLLHRENDAPAVEFDTCKHWYWHGNLHRFGDKPAIVFENGNQQWFVHGCIHRGSDKPAVVNACNEDDDLSKEEWWTMGKLHRLAGGPAVVEFDGTCRWYDWGVLHRDNDLPAIDGPTKEWWVRGRRHRADGPAVITADQRFVWFDYGCPRDPENDIFGYDYNLFYHSPTI